MQATRPPSRTDSSRGEPAATEHLPVWDLASETHSGDPEMRSGRPETRSGDAEHRSGYPRDPFRRPETRLSHSETLPSDAEIQSGDSETRSRSGEMSPSGAEMRLHDRKMTFDRSGDRSERRRDTSTEPRRAAASEVGSERVSIARQMNQFRKTKAPRRGGALRVTPN